MDAGTVSNFFEKFNLRSGMEKVTLEDSRFESIFGVYGTDQVESRYLLTTAFMERMIKLREINSGINNILAHICNVNLLKINFVIAIPSKTNLFERSSIFGNVFNIEDLHKFLKQINEIFMLIDALRIA